MSMSDEASIANRVEPVESAVAVAPGSDDPERRSRAGSRAWPILKRTFDIGVAIVTLTLLLPVLALIALSIKIDTPGALLFRQRRYGRDLRPFTVWKFRTMHEGVSSAAHERYIAALAHGRYDDDPGLKKLTGDPRVTRCGALLRKMSLDELPQLVNVLRGQMSLVGPRPALEYELDHYAAVHFDRFLVRPGITGLWQVSGRNRLGFIQMLDLDVAYAHDCGPRMDTKILLRTPLAVLSSDAA